MISEADYITVSNLARVRSALGILRDYARSGEPHDDLIRQASIALGNAENVLADLIDTDEANA